MNGIKIAYNIKHLGSFLKVLSFQLVIKRKAGKTLNDSSRLESPEKDAGDNTSGSLKRGGIADLPLLRTLLAICQKF